MGQRLGLICFPCARLCVPWLTFNPCHHPAGGYHYYQMRKWATCSRSQSQAETESNPCELAPLHVLLTLFIASQEAATRGSPQGPPSSWDGESRCPPVPSGCSFLPFWKWPLLGPLVAVPLFTQSQDPSPASPHPRQH